MAISRIEIPTFVESVILKHPGDTDVMVRKITEMWEDTLDANQPQTDEQGEDS